jgi:hypothetical protein
MTDNTINGLRGHLFDMLANLKDPEKKIDTERYKLANDMAQTIINSAKVEVDAARVYGHKPGTGFIPTVPALPGDTPPGQE